MTHADSQAADSPTASELGGPLVTMLYIGLLAPPTAWFLQLIANFALASHSCFPMGVARASFLPGWEHVWSTLLLVNVACAIIVIAALAAASATYFWLRPRRRQQGPEHHEILTVAEARTQTFAASGVLMGMLFTAAVLVNTLSLSTLSTCSQV